MYCFVRENHDDRIRNKPLKGFTGSVFSFKVSTEHMRFWSEQRWISTYRNDLSATGWALTDILVIEKPDDRRGIQILQPGQILLAAQKIPAQRDLTILVPWRQKTVVTDPYDPFWRDMHQEPADEFFAGDCDLFPLSLVFVIFSSKGPVFYYIIWIIPSRQPFDTGAPQEMKNVQNSAACI